jgi:hypothetical protein
VLLVWILTFILAGLDFAPALSLWHWFGAHVFYTVLLLIFFA